MEGVDAAEQQKKEEGPKKGLGLVFAPFEQFNG